MARTGRFGRLPRAAPNLSSVIVALTREMNALMDRNIVDAWEKGGEVDGKKITDEDLLAHFRKRRDNVDQQDPLWEYYDNLLTNYEFNIADSKMTLQYAQEKVSDSQMAAFYEGWATKFPTDSEAYRNTMRTAAAYRSRAKQVSSAGASRARAQAYQNALTNIYDGYQKDWDIASTIITRALQGAGVLAPNEKLDDMRTTGETNVEHDFSGLLAIFDTLSNSSDPYYVTLRGELEANGLGGLSYADFLALGQRYQTGWNLAATTATQYGDGDNARKYRENAAEFGFELAFVEDADEWTLYERRRQDFLDEWTQPGLSQFEYRDIANRYAADLQKMMPDATSSALHGALSSEINVILNPTAPIAGQSGIEVGSGAMSDLQGTLQDLNIFDDQIERVRRGDVFFSNTTLQANGALTPDWTIISPALTTNEQNGMVVMMQQGASSVPVYITFSDIRSEAQGAPDPESLETTTGLKPVAGSSTLIGKTYIDPNTGQRKYGVFTTGGVLQWFDDPPFKLPDGSTPAANSYAPGADGTITIQWTPAADTTDPAKAGGVVSASGEYEPDAIVDDDLVMGGDEIEGKYDSAERQTYMSSQNGRLALLNTSDAEYAQTLKVRGIPDDQAASRLANFYTWKVEAAATENARMEDRRATQRAGLTTPLGTSIRPSLMEGSVETRASGYAEEFAVPESATSLRARFLTERDRLRIAAQTFLTTNGLSSPQNTRLLQQMTPKEIGNWLAQAKLAVAARAREGAIPGVKPSWEPKTTPAPQLPALGSGSGPSPYSTANKGGTVIAAPTIKVPLPPPPVAPPVMPSSTYTPPVMGGNVYEQQAALKDAAPTPKPTSGLGGFDQY